MERVLIFDTTLRDGEQSPGASMNLGEKVLFARQLERLNVDVIEAGFPASSPGDFESVKRISQEIRGPQIAGLARTTPKDIDTAWQALKQARAPRIHVFIATSDIHLKYKLRKSREEVLEETGRAVAQAKRYTDNVEFSCEDATRSDPDYLARVLEAAIDAGATTVNIPDTVGYTTPTEYAKLLTQLRQKVKNIKKAVVSIHCHDDLGMAVANSLAAIENGARQVECTVNGIGERAGNASMEEIVMALKTRKDFFNFEVGILTEQIYPASRLLTSITGIQVPPNKAIVGANAFAHESGIHQDGVLKEKITYEIMKPETVGITQSTLILGKHSGRHAFRDRVLSLGYELSETHLNQAFQRFKDVADKKKQVFDEDLEAIIADEILRIPDFYKLVNMNVVSGSTTVPTSTVQIEIGGKLIQDAAFGDGPVDAAYKTISKITKTKSHLVKFSVNAITSGTDAQGEVMVILEESGIRVTGQGAHTDIIMAAAKAYINALNKLEYQKRPKGVPS
ncbi:MAG: 2-isopropylmalate synthase [Deltaproteobacteria bacterium SM23_61]|nr:MAG: 2-isopropylmalate synthase [Deltaproteobacteria bacterium SM23_61]